MTNKQMSGLCRDYNIMMYLSLLDLNSLDQQLNLLSSNCLFRGLLKIGR